jgi:hypothetical protein
VDVTGQAPIHTILHPPSCQGISPQSRSHPHPHLPPLPQHTSPRPSTNLPFIHHKSEPQPSFQTLHPHPSPSAATEMRIPAGHHAGYKKKPPSYPKHDRWTNPSPPPQRGAGPCHRRRDAAAAGRPRYEVRQEISPVGGTGPLKHTTSAYPVKRHVHTAPPPHVSASLAGV